MHTTSGETDTVDLGITSNITVTMTAIAIIPIVTNLKIAYCFNLKSNMKIIFNWNNYNNY